MLQEEFRERGSHCKDSSDNEEMDEAEEADALEAFLILASELEDDMDEDDDE